MKAKTKLIALLIALPFFFISCQKSELIDDSKSTDPVVPGSDNLKSGIVYCGTPITAVLTTYDQTITAGTVTIGNDENNLYVTYELTDDYYLANVALYVGPFDNIPGTINPDGTGSFSPWNFPYKYFPWQVTQDHTFTIDLSTLDDCFAVVCYAWVEDQSNVPYQYYEMFGKNNYKCLGFYFEYCKQDCEPPPPLGGCETAFAFGGNIANCFLDIKKDGTLNPNGNPSQNFNRWGWTNGAIGTGTYDMEIWAAAGQCDHTNGTLVGTLSVVYEGTTATIAYIMYPGYVMDETHLYVGNNILPKKKNKYTVAPGQYPHKHDGLNGVSSDTYIVDGLSGDIYIVGHAVVCDE